MRLRPKEPGHGRLTDLLVWGAFIAPGILLNKDGALQTTYRFRGPDLDSTTTSGLVATMARINNALRRLGSGWALHLEARRRVSDDYPDLIRTPPAAWLIDRERHRIFAESGTKLITDYFPDLHLPAARGPVGEGVRLAVREPADRGQPPDRGSAAGLRRQDQPDRRSLERDPADDRTAR